MKLPYKLPIAIASIAIAASNISAGQGQAFTHNLNVTLKSSSAPYESSDDSVKDKPPGKYAYSEKIVIQKISNKEILEVLLNEGELLDDTSIKGWSIVLVTYTGYNESDGTPAPEYYGATPGIEGFYAKKGNSLVDINDYFGTDDDYGFAVTSVSGKRTLDTEGDTVTDSGKYTTSLQLLASLELNLSGLYSQVAGLLEAPAEGTYEYDYEYDYTFYQSSFKNGNFTSLTGLSYYDESEEPRGIVTGNVTAANGKLITINPS